MIEGVAGRVRVNVAVTVVVPFIVMVHVPVPVQAPDHPVKVDPDEAVAVKEIAVPLFTDAEQVEPQLTEPPDTVPVPVPAFDTVRVYFAGVTGAGAIVRTRIAAPMP